MTSVILMDLRVLGAFETLPRAPFVALLRRLALTAFCVALLTGFAMFTIRATEYASMPIFLAKMALSPWQPRISRFSSRLNVGNSGQCHRPFASPQQHPLDFGLGCSSADALSAFCSVFRAAQHLGHFRSSRKRQEFLHDSVAHCNRSDFRLAFGQNVLCAKSVIKNRRDCSFQPVSLGRHVEGVAQAHRK